MEEGKTPTPDASDQVILPDSPDIPEKFRGKSLTEVIKSYQEAEKTMHQKAQEAAEFRKQLEELKQQAEKFQQQQQQQQQQKDTNSDFPVNLDEEDIVTTKDLKAILSQLEQKFRPPSKEEIQQVVQESLPQLVQLFKTLNEAEQIQREYELNEAEIQAMVTAGQLLGAETIQDAQQKLLELVHKIGQKTGGIVTVPNPLPHEGIGETATERQSLVQEIFNSQQNKRLSDLLE